MNEQIEVLNNEAIKEDAERCAAEIINGVEAKFRAVMIERAPNNHAYLHSGIRFKDEATKIQFKESLLEVLRTRFERIYQELNT